jgi:hypothetical protein
MIDLRKFAPKLFQSDAEDRPLTPEELREARLEKQHNAPKHGPYGPGGSHSVRWLTNGQIRRMHERGVKAQQRKARKRFRRQWMANEAAFHTLRSQLDLLAKRPESALAPGVIKVLEERYGSVEEARAYLQTLQAERIANSVSAA